MFQYLSNSWTYDDREFKNMARRIEFNVNHIKSKVFDEYNGIYQNQKVSFPPDLNYNICKFSLNCRANARVCSRLFARVNSDPFQHEN